MTTFKNIRTIKTIRRRVSDYKGKQELILYAVVMLVIVVLIGNGLQGEIGDYAKGHPKRPKTISKSITPTKTITATASGSVRNPSIAKGLVSAPTHILTSTLTISPAPTIHITPTITHASHAVVQSESTTNIPATPTSSQNFVTPTPDQTLTVFSSPAPAGESAQPCLTTFTNTCLLTSGNIISLLK